jgi:hypothetical protein
MAKIPCRRACLREPRRGTGTARQRSQSPYRYARKPMRRRSDWFGPFLLLRRFVM